MNVARALTLIGAIVLIFLAQPTLAGPPFLTDDPETVDYQHWEINTYAAGGQVRSEASGVAPGADINYGALPNVQVHINISMAYDQLSGGPLNYGYGDTELGVKYRFINPGEDDWWPQVAVYPLLEVPTGDASKGLGATGKMREFLPVWLQKDFDEWTTYGGGGYWNNPGLGNKNYWFFGGVLQRKTTDSLTARGRIISPNGRNHHNDSLR